MTVGRLHWKVLGITTLAAALRTLGPGMGDPALGAQQILAQAQQPGTGPAAGAHAHVHAPVPAAYATSHIPARAWTDPKMIAKGKEIYTAKCALCHGEKGDGKGPGSLNLPLKPADFTDAKMVGEMAGNFWFWRVSEGGLVEPYKSIGSAMPPWKGELTIPDRWAVIAYVHTLSGHQGPHTPGEHPGLGGGHAGH
ncbi:MAG TPA: cytochrome c [Methylomirabilota bacterium]|nr:cytochrome c [Methylomirabilota bacterium]